MDDTNGEDQWRSPDAPGGLTAEPDLLADQDIIDGESGASAKITDDQTIVDIGNKEAPQRDTADSDVREKTGLHEKGEADDLEKGTEQGPDASLMMASDTSFPGEDRGKIVSTKEQSVSLETPTVVENEGVLPYEVDSILLTGSELTTAENAAGETRDNLDQISADIEANQMTDLETEVLQGANDNHGNEGADEEVLVLEGTSEDKPMEYISDTAQSSSHIQIPADEKQTQYENGGASGKDNMEDIASVDPESKQEMESLIQVADIPTTELETNLLDVNETPINVDENIVHFEPDPQPIETVTSPLLADTGEMKELQVAIDEGEDRQEDDLRDPDLPLQDTISPVAVVPESEVRMGELKPAVDKEGSEGDLDLEPPSAETISPLPVVTSESEVCVEEIKPAVDEDKGENNEELVDLEAPLKIATSSLAVVDDTKEIEVCEQDLQPNIDEIGGEKEGRPRELDEPLQEPVSSLAVEDTDKSEVLEELQPAIVEGNGKREEELSRDLEETRKEPVSSPAVEDATEIEVLEEIQPAIDEGGGEREEEPRDFQDKSNDIAEDNVSDSDESQVNSLPSLPDDATSSDKADENGAVAADNGTIETADNTTYSDKADGIGAIAIDTEPQNSENELNNAELNIIRALDGDIAKETDLPNSDNVLEQENLNIAGTQGVPRWKEGETCETLSELSPQVVDEENINQDQALETCALPNDQPAEHLTADLMDKNEMPSEERVFDKREAVIPPSSSDISTNVTPTQNPERSEDVGAVGETLLQDAEPVSVEVVSHDDYTSTMQDDRPAADPTDAVVFNGASKVVPEDDKLRGNNDEVIGAVSDGHERVQIPEAAALMQDIPEPVTVPSSMGAVSLQTKEETEENEKQISDKIILSDPTVFVDTGAVTESVDEGHSIQEIAQAPVTPDPKQTETEPADTRENYETRHDLVPTVSSTDNEESQSFQDTSSATSHDLVTTVNSTDEDKEPDDVRQQSETRHDPVPTVLSIKEEDVQSYQDTSPLLDTSSKQKKSILTEERAPVKPDVPDVIPSTQYEEQEASGPHDEKAPLVKKDKDESKTSYGTSEIDDEDVKKKKPSNFYLRIRDLVHSYCNIL